MPITLPNSGTQKIVKGDTCYIPILSFATEGNSFTMVGGSAFAVEQGTNTKIATGVTLTTASIAPGVSRLAVDTSDATYDRGKRYDVWVVSASISSNTYNLIAGSFEIDTEILARTTVTSANASVMTVAFSVDADNRFVGASMRVIRGSANMTPAHIIVDSSSSPANRLFLAPAMGITPVVGDVIEILATPYVEEIAALPANLTQVASVSMSALHGYNFWQFFNGAGASTTLDIESLRENISQIRTKVETTGVVVASGEVSSEITAILSQPLTEPSSAPAWTSVNVGQAMGWLLARHLNRHDQTTTAIEIYTSGGTAIASASAGVASNIARRDQFLG